jgi:hypothetical protein
MISEDARKYLIQIKFIFGLGLTGMFLIMKMVFNYEHIPIGIGYIVLFIGMINIVWAIYDYVLLRNK